MQSPSLDAISHTLSDTLQLWNPSYTSGHVTWIGPEAASISQVAVRWPVGFQDEDASQSGYAHLCEHSLFRGAGGRTSRESRLLTAGGISNGRTNSRSTIYWSAALRARRALALENETARYIEPVAASWVAHQAEIVRAELLTKVRGQVDGYVRLRQALAELGAKIPSQDGYGNDALATGLAGFEAFLSSHYRGVPVMAVSGFPEREVLLTDGFDSLQAVQLVADQDLSSYWEERVDIGVPSGGSAWLYVLNESLGIVDRAVLGAALSLVLADIGAAQMSLHLWGDAITETTTPPFLVMIDAGDHAWPDIRQRLRAMNERSAADVVEAALPRALTWLKRLTSDLHGPWAAQALVSLLERRRSAFEAPQVIAASDGGVLPRCRDILVAVAAAGLLQ
jgi:hypothetical protein